MEFANDHAQVKPPANCSLSAAHWWKSVASQSRDLSANANCSPLESARKLREWAASKADNPNFAAHARAAQEAAARTVQACRPRSV